MPGSEIGGMLIIHGSLWTFAYLLQILSQNETRIILFHKTQFMLGQLMPALFTVYVIMYLEIKIKSPKQMYAALFSLPFITAINALLNDPFNIMWRSFQITEYTQVMGNHGVLSDIIVLYNYLIIVILLLYFIKMLLQPQQIKRIRLSVFFLAVAIYSIIFAFDYYGNTLLNYEFAPLIFNILSSSIMLLKPETMYRRDVLPVVHGIVMENMNNPVLVMDDEYKIIYLNEKAKELGNVKELKFLQQDFTELFNELYNHINNNEEKIDVIEYNNTIYRVNKHHVDDWQKKKISIIVLNDVTELVQYSNELESRVEKKSEQLIKAERLAAIGKITSMVGHDLRNPLQVIRLIGGQLENRSTDDLSRNMVQRINKNVIYMEKIVSDLQMLAKNKEPAPKIVKLCEIIEDSRASVDVPDSIEVACELSHEKMVFLDESMFSRVFVNLLNNAVQAMKEGGQIRVSSYIDEGFDVIVINNTGTVIPKKTIENMFTPFFTTKAKGMGLGLSVCKRIVESHSGNISVESTEENGTSFFVKIPCHVETINTYLPYLETNLTTI